MTISTEIKLLSQIEGRTNPFKRLAAAVISQAVKDATQEIGRNKKSATTWLLQDKDGFPFWCNVLGMDPDQARQELSDLLSSPIKRSNLDYQSQLHPVPEGHGASAFLDLCSAANCDRLPGQG